MAVSKRLRFEILRRDNHACHYCGGTPPDVRLTVDHVVPVTLGGSDDPSNLIAACVDCNAGKSSVPADAALVSVVSSRAMFWRDVFTDCMETWRLELQGLELMCDDFRSAWQTWKYANGDAVELGDGWRSSVDQWVRLGFEVDDLVRLIPEAMKRGIRDPWPYFCKVVWNNLHDIQERTESVLDGQESYVMPDDPALYAGHGPRALWNMAGC